MLLAALIAFVAPPATAEPPQPCSRANSAPATMVQVHSERRRLLHRCVAVSALYRANALIASIDTLYLPGMSWSGDPDQDPAFRQLLILENDRVLRRLPRSGVYLATAYGRVQDCEEIRQAVQATAGPGEIVMTMGLCHHLPGIYLRVHEVRIGVSVPAARLTGEANRARVGDLVAPPAGWPHRRFVEDYAQRYLTALRAGNRAALLALHLSNDQPREAGAAVRLALGHHRGFKAIRTAPRPPQTAIFLHDAPGPDASAASDRNSRRYGATICFCRIADCSERWPISEIDADNREDRPYVCVGFGAYVVRGGREMPAFTAEQSDAGLLEPGANSSTR